MNWSVRITAVKGIQEAWILLICTSTLLCSGNTRDATPSDDLQKRTAECVPSGEVPCPNLIQKEIPLEAAHQRFCTEYPQFCQYEHIVYDEKGRPTKRRFIVLPAGYTRAALYAPRQPFYGNWCGRGSCSTAPTSGNCSARKDKFSPIDPVDAACKVHDACYDLIIRDRAKDFPPLPDTRSPERVCDAILIHSIAPYVRQLSLVTPDPRDRMLNAAAAVTIYFKYLKKGSLIEVADFKKVKDGKRK